MKKIVLFLTAFLFLSNIYSQNLIATIPLEHNLDVVLSAKDYQPADIVAVYLKAKKAWGRSGEVAVLKKLVKDGNVEAMKSLQWAADFTVRDIYDEDIYFWALQNNDEKWLEFLDYNKIDIYKKNKYGISLIDYCEFAGTFHYAFNDHQIRIFKSGLSSKIYQDTKKREENESKTIAENLVNQVKNATISDKNLLTNLNTMQSRIGSIRLNIALLSGLYENNLLDEFFLKYPQTGNKLIDTSDDYFGAYIMYVKDEEIKKKYLKKVLSSSIFLSAFNNDLGLTYYDNEIFKSLDAYSKTQFKPILDQRKVITDAIEIVFNNSNYLNDIKDDEYYNKIALLKKMKEYKLTASFEKIWSLSLCRNYELVSEMLRLDFPYYGFAPGMFPQLIDPLYEAILINRIDLVSLYVNKLRTNHSESGFLTKNAYKAVLAGNADVLRTILAGGADYLKTGQLQQIRNNGSDFYGVKLNYPFTFLVYSEGYMSRGGTEFYDVEYKNESLLHFAIKNKKPYSVYVLMDHGFDPYDIYSFNKLEYIEQPSVALNPKYPDQKTKIYRINIISTSEVDAFRLAKSLGFSDTEKSMKDYLAGLVMPDYLVNSLQVLLERADYKQLEDLVSVIKSGAERYCPRDRKLLRRVYFYLGNYYFRDKKYVQAIGWYKKGIAKGESNLNEITDDKNLQKQKLEEWVKEGELNGGAAFQAYNIACCFSLQGDQSSALAWLKIAIRLDPKTKEYALGDADLAALRQKYGDKF